MRIGAIYALERIAQDSLRDHIQIMEILCAYIRQNAPASEAPKDVKPRADIQTALTVIGRRSEKQKAKEWGDEESFKAFQKGPLEFPKFEADESGVPTQVWRDAVDGWKSAFYEWKRLAPAYRLNLSETNLRKADMASHSHNVDFSFARFDYADLRSATFWRAKVQGALFGHVEAREAVFRYARAQGAHFWHVQAQGANLQQAQAQGAYFFNAQFDEKTDFTATQLFSVALKGDISMLKLTQEQFNAAFGDGFTARHLPDGLTKPDHWPDWEMEVFEFGEEWRKWQREGAAYVPPPISKVS